MGSYNVLLLAMSCSTFYVGITITPLQLIDTFNNKRQIPSRIKKQTFEFHLSHTKLSVEDPCIHLSFMKNPASNKFRTFYFY